MGSKSLSSVEQWGYGELCGPVIISISRCLRSGGLDQIRADCKPGVGLVFMCGLCRVTSVSFGIGLRYKDLGGSFERIA